MVICIYVGLKMDMLPLSVFLLIITFIWCGFVLLSCGKPFIYSNVENPTIFAHFFGGLIPPGAACDHGCLCAVAVGVCSGKTSQAFGLSPCWTFQRELSGFAGKGLMMGCLCCSRGLWPKLRLSPCLWAVSIASSSMCSWQLPLMSISFQRSVPGAAVEMVPQAETWQRFYKGVQNPTEMKSLLQKYMANGTKVLVCLLNCSATFPPRTSLEYIMGIQMRTTKSCLSKQNQRPLST